jgi:hypothetical protein
MARRALPRRRWCCRSCGTSGRVVRRGRGIGQAEPGGALGSAVTSTNTAGGLGQLKRPGMQMPLTVAGPLKMPSSGSWTGSRPRVASAYRRCASSRLVMRWSSPGKAPQTTISPETTAASLRRRHSSSVERLGGAAVTVRSIRSGGWPVAPSCAAAGMGAASRASKAAILRLDIPHPKRLSARPIAPWGLNFR